MRYSIRYLVFTIMAMSVFSIVAQDTFNKGDIIVKTAPSPHKGRVVLHSIENLYDKTVGIVFVNDFEEGHKRSSKTYFLKKGEKQNWDVTFNAIIATPEGSGESVEIFRISGKSGDQNESVNPVKDVEIQRHNDLESHLDHESGHDDRSDVISAEVAINGFRTFIDSIPFFSSTRLAEDSLAISRHIANLNLPSIDRVAYIKDEMLDKYLMNFNDSISFYQNEGSLMISGYLDSLGKIEKRDSCEKEMFAMLTGEIKKKSDMFDPLGLIVDENKDDRTAIDNKIFIVCGGVVLLCLLLIIWYRKVSKKSRGGNDKRDKRMSDTAFDSCSDAAPSLVVVGTKTAPVLKRQSLDDIYDNDSYLKIECVDFCSDSKVRTLYIKNSCAKDIYNMYAEDLRNPDNPKEDGCMVIGRWVYDEASGKYDISLEYIVLPGDDAVFAEYELNFGGKIKLKMSEKLRKLRKETGLQYDLTCWVHSHPGLGVFFSNSDNNVHHQLKHPLHPGFLTAFVIDILTPQQDMGIFTFKNTDEVNSMNELKKHYSLEEIYKWALASERRSFDAADYFDILGHANANYAPCCGVQLSNSAIIDMTYLTSKPNGFCGFVHGYLHKRGERTQCIVSEVSGRDSAPDSDMIGCFVVASHCSIPSLRKLISHYLRDIHFVLVYTASDGLLTAIPVIDNDLVNNDSYYGEKTLEDLKIWTRRRR